MVHTDGAAKSHTAHRRGSATGLAQPATPSNQISFFRSKQAGSLAARLTPAQPSPCPVGQGRVTAGADETGSLPSPLSPRQWSWGVAPAPNLRYLRGVEMEWADIEEAVDSLGLDWAYTRHKPRDPRLRLQLQTDYFEIHHSGGYTLVQGTHGWRASVLDAALLQLRKVSGSRAAPLSRAHRLLTDPERV